MNQRHFSRFIVALACACAAAHAQDPEQTVVIKVIDKSKAPVESDIFLNPGMKSMGSTSALGVYSFKHTCEAGQQFKAQPRNRGRYYDSEWKVCGTSVEIAVFPRPDPGTELASYETFKPGQWNAIPNTGTVVTGVVVGVLEKTEPLAGGRNGRCRVTVDKMFAVSAYDTNRKTWTKVSDLPTAQAPKELNPVYVFSTPCEEAQPDIAVLKMKASIEADLVAKKLSASKDVGDDVKKVMKGMDFKF